MDRGAFTSAHAPFWKPEYRESANPELRYEKEPRARCRETAPWHHALGKLIASGRNLFGDSCPPREVKRDLGVRSLRRRLARGVAGRLEATVGGTEPRRKAPRSHSKWQTWRIASDSAIGRGPQANYQKMMLSDSSRCVERNQLTSRLTSDVERNTRYSDLLFCGVVRSNVMPTNISGSCHLELGSKPSLFLGSKNSTRSVRPVSL